MASRFMKSKKIIIPFMILAIMASQLAGCGAVSGRESLDAAVDVGGQQSAADAADADTGSGDHQEAQKAEEIGHDELMAVFEENYEISKSLYNSDEGEIIRSELEMIKTAVKGMDKTLPFDYEAQYRTWRPSVGRPDPKAPDSEYNESPNVAANEEDGGSLEGWDSSGEVITDPQDDPYAGSLISGEELNEGMQTAEEGDTGVIDPYLGSDLVEIGSGEDIGTDSGGPGISSYTPGGIKIVDGN